MTSPQDTNLVSLFFNQAARLQNKAFLWHKINGTYQSLNWTAAETQVIKLAGALNKLGVGKGDRVVLVSENRPGWAIADLAIMAAGAITVPAYTTNTVNDHRHILNNSQAKAAIVSTAKLAENLLQATHGSSDIEFVISMEPLGLHQELSHAVYDWQSVTADQDGDDNQIRNRGAELSEEDTACIIYTSGTGGTPKGVMLPHRAILHNCRGATSLLKSIGLENEVFLSFLPLSHSYEHTAGLMWPIYLGAEIYYAEGADTIAANMTECQPTLMTAVPRLYEMMRLKILRGLAQQSLTKRRLFHKTVRLGTRQALGQRLGLIDSIKNFALEKLVRDKVRQRFGGRLKAMVSGGGPLNPDVGHFFQGLGIRVLQGYGQTESGPVISVNPPQKVKMHTVGPVLDQTDLKIAEDGEILVRGELVMQGYWRNDKATADVMRDGWLHTGDIGLLDEDGYLEITDRKKDIIVNSGGDNISPQRVEGFLSLEQEITQCMVYGDKRPHLVALIVPDEEFAKEWATAHNKSSNLSELINDPDFHKVFVHTVNRANENLSSLERIRKFILTDQPFTIENEQMTPTLKVRRHVLNKLYGDRLEGLY